MMRIIPPALLLLTACAAPPAQIDSTSSFSRDRDCHRAIQNSIDLSGFVLAAMKDCERGIGNGCQRMAEGTALDRKVGIEAESSRCFDEGRVGWHTHEEIGQLLRTYQEILDTNERLQRKVRAAGL